MASPPKLKRLSADSFEDAPEWFTDVFLPSFNDFATTAVNALNGGLTAPENVSAYIETPLRVTSDVAGLIGFPLVIANRLGRLPACVTIARLEVATGGAPTGLAAAVGLVWDLTSDGRIRVLDFPGLPLSVDWRISLKVE